MASSFRDPVIRFAVYEVDLRSGELRKSGARVRLQEKPLRVLTTLLERPGELVTRDELRDALWPADISVDFDIGLNNAVNRLRSALSDSADNPRYIETVGRRGYRFIFPVTPIPVPASPLPGGERVAGSPATGAVSIAPFSREVIAAPTQESRSLQPPAVPRTLEPATAQSRRPRWIRIGVSGAAVAAFGVIITVIAQQPSWHSRLTSRSIAVLPLANYSGDPTQDYFADGMTEALIAELARIRSLRVIGRTSVMQYRRTAKPLSHIARELDVDAIVEGSVARSGDRVRITARLIERATDSQSWADTYDRDLRDVLSLQRDVAMTIAGAVRAELSGLKERGAVDIRPVDPEAFDLYLQGRNACTLRQPPQEVRKGVEFLRQAVNLDPQYARAHAALAACYVALGTVLIAEPPRPTRALAAASAKKAIELDDGLASAHATLAQIYAREWNFERAAEEYRRAIQLAPSDAAIRGLHASYLAAQGRTDESIAEARLAEGLDPLSLHERTQAGWVLQLARHQDEAIQKFQSVLGVDPNFLFARWLMGISYSLKGMHPQAIECFATAEKLSPSSSNTAWRAYALAMAGRSGEAQQVLDGLIAKARREYVPPVMIGFVFMALGDFTQAFEWLERGYAERSNALLYFGVYEVVDPLRSDPRFVDLMRRIGMRSSPR